MDGRAAVNRRLVMMHGMVGRGIVHARRRTLARKARTRAGERDDAGEDRAEKRQEDDGLVHRKAQPFIKLMSSTAIEPRLRKKTTRMARPIAASAAATVSTNSA